MGGRTVPENGRQYLAQPTRTIGGGVISPTARNIATAAFEIGDPTLAKEKSNGVEVYLRGRAGSFHVSAAAYYSDFANFIYEVPNGRGGGRPARLSIPARAAPRYSGFEMDFGVDIYERDGVKLSAHGVTDVVFARLKGGNGDIPRIPPLRLLGGIDAELGDLRLGGEVEWTAKQDRIAAFETATDGYTLVNLSLGWKFLGKGRESLIILSADNIFDVEARRHASFTKDFVPMAGRDIRLGVHMSF